MPTFTLSYDTTSTTMTSAAWNDWATADTSAGVTVTWINWTSNGATGTYSPAYQMAEPTPEAAAEMQRRQDEWEVAKVRARALLEENLTARQRRSLRERKWFEVRGSQGGIYRIKHGHAGNVVKMEGDRPRSKLCGYPHIERVPDEDAMLAQKLMLETDEPAFIRLANHSAIGDWEMAA